MESGAKKKKKRDNNICINRYESMEAFYVLYKN